MEPMHKGGGEDLTSVGTHFRFGDNWRDFVESQISAERIEDAKARFGRLFLPDEIRGKRFIDIGCGSGLSMLCALESGPAVAAGIDLDPSSVEAARALLSRHAQGLPWTVTQRSVFDPELGKSGRYDVVHSWGVLHHTGDMWRALDAAAGLVADQGLIAVALYRRTRMCGFWAIEKRVYRDLPSSIQWLVRFMYKALFCLYLILRLKNPLRVLREYSRTKRGMNFDHDAHDWLGGYPYESVRAEEVKAFFGARGFAFLRGNIRRPGSGLFGTGNDEFVFRRNPGLAPRQAVPVTDRSPDRG